MCWRKMTLGGGAMIKQESVWSTAHPCPNSVILLGSAGKTLHIIKTGYSQEGCFTATNGTIMFRVASVPHNLKGMDDDCSLSRRERQVPGLQSHLPKTTHWEMQQLELEPRASDHKHPLLWNKRCNWGFLALRGYLPRNPQSNTKALAVVYRALK